MSDEFDASFDAKFSDAKFGPDEPPQGVKSNGAAHAPEFPRFMSADEFVAGYVPQRPLIKAWDLKTGWLYSFTAPTGYAKTAIALTESLRLARLGKRVVYLAGENPDDVRARMLLMEHVLELDAWPATFKFVDRTFDLHQGIEHIGAEVSAMGGADLIIVDTSPAFQVASGGVEENNNAEAIQWALRLRELSRLEGRPAVNALCHPIKRPQSVEDCLPRGGGGFIAEMDGNYASWLTTEDGDDKFFEFRWIGKFRGHFEPTVYRLRRATCPHLVDADGNPAHSVWAEVADECQLDLAASGQTEDEDAVLMAVADYPGKSLSDWAKLLGWKTGSGAPAKNRVDRALRRMAKEKLVRLGRGRQWHLLEAGKREAKRVAERTRNAAV